MTCRAHFIDNSCRNAHQNVGCYPMVAVSSVLTVGDARGALYELFVFHQDQRKSFESSECPTIVQFNCTNRRLCSNAYFGITPLRMYTRNRY